MKVNLHPKRKQATEATEPTLSEQALAATVREQRDTIDTLKTQVNLYRDQWQTAANNASRLFADLCQKEADADQWGAWCFSDWGVFLPVSR